MAVNIAAVFRTNLSKCNEKEFLTEMTKFLGKKFEVQLPNITLEVHTNVTMMRGGSDDPMMNVSIYHNCDKINQSTKGNIATEIATHITKCLSKSKGSKEVPVERVLVLFFDARKCTF